MTFDLFTYYCENIIYEKILFELIDKIIKKYYNYQNPNYNLNMDDLSDIENILIHVHNVDNKNNVKNFLYYITFEKIYIKYIIRWIKLTCIFMQYLHIRDKIFQYYVKDVRIYSCNNWADYDFYFSNYHLGDGYAKLRYSI